MDYGIISSLTIEKNAFFCYNQYEFIKREEQRMFKTELEHFLNSKKVADFVSVAVKKTPEEYKKLSDFERFSLICENSDFLIGSEVIKQFFALLCSLTEENLTLTSLKNRHFQNRIWRLLHGGDSLNLIGTIEAQISCVDYCKTHDNFESLDIIKYLLKCPSKSLDDLFENSVISTANSFFIDLNNFEYSRPDEYHANTIYQKIVSGEKYRKDELCLLASHVICNVGKTKKCNLRIVINNDITAVFQLAELFEKRSADVEISLCFDLISCNMFEQIFDIMLKKGKKISSEIIISEDEDDNDIRNRMRELLQTIPYSRIKWQKDYTAYIDECRIG